MELSELKQHLKPGIAVLGFDYGSKRLGVAVSDLLQNIATSYTIIFRESFAKDVAAIKKIIADKQIGAVIYGLPLLMDGTEGATAAEVRTFAAKIFAETKLPYAFWDERLSSAAMEKFLIGEVDMSRAKRKKTLDASAAAYILQGALDRLNRL